MDKAIKPLWQVWYLFLLLGMVFIPFPFSLFPWAAELSFLLFDPAIQFLSGLLGLSVTPGVTGSDSLWLFLLLAILAMVAVLLRLFTTRIWRKHAQKATSLLRVAMSYYLALQLMNYGLDKVFKAQFYLPEPNTLYTPFGMLGKDLLFWSTMGLSRSYSVFLGLLEVIPALFLLYKPTRNLGLLIATGVLLHIVAINLSFDISVKLYSSFLLLIALTALSPILKPLASLFIKGKAIQPKAATLPFRISIPVKMGLKSFVIILIFLETAFPFVYGGSFNDDTVPRPPLHGAYQVTAIELISPNQGPYPQVKRFFIHRKGYLIFQNADESLQDFKLQIDEHSKVLSLLDYEGKRFQLHYDYDPSARTMRLQYFHQEAEYLLEAQELEWQSLPALQDGFHWSIDEIE